jgi:hypothetical protein
MVISLEGVQRDGRKGRCRPWPASPSPAASSPFPLRHRKLGRRGRTVRRGSLSLLRPTVVVGT